MKTITAGKTVEVHKHYSARFGKKCSRSEKREPTDEKQKEINTRHARDRLRWLINTNFGVGDIHLVLGYRREYLKTPTEAKADLCRFLRKYREWCERESVTVRYITVTEYENKRIHHHLVIGAVPMSVLYELWPFGRPHITPLDNSGNYAQLADYLIKETSKTFSKAEAVTRKRWTQSKGLKKPIIKHTIVPAGRWREEPKPTSGYYIPRDSIVSGINDVTGMPFQQYVMIETTRGRAGPRRE